VSGYFCVVNCDFIIIASVVLYLGLVNCNLVHKRLLWSSGSEALLSGGQGEEGVGFARSSSSINLVRWISFLLDLAKITMCFN